MIISGSYNSHPVNDMGITNKKGTSVKEYSNYLTQKYNCLTPCQNASVSITSGLLRKAVTDEKTGAWLERELAKAPDYIEAAQKSAMAHDSTLKFVSIEFGEEYTTMITITVSGDEGDTDPGIDKWLEKVREKKADNSPEQNQDIQKSAEHKMEFKGTDLEDLINQFSTKLSEPAMPIPDGSVNVIT